MNINELTLGQIKEIQSLLGNPSAKAHPFTGERVIAILPHGFIFYGILGPDMLLAEASNIRYYTKRDGGLPEFAAKGPVSDDRIDKLPGMIDVSKAICFYQTGEWK